MGTFRRQNRVANAIAVLALFIAAGGGAYAAGKIDSGDIAKRGVKAKNLAPSAVKNKKIASGAVSGEKLADGAITTPRIADGAVAAAKLDPGERSEAFVTNQTSLIAVQLDGPGFTDTDRIAQLVLPSPGAYLVNAQATFGPTSAGERFVACVLRDDGGIVTRGDTSTSAVAAFSSTITLNAIVDGGAIDLACQASGATNARNRVLIATRVGTVNVQ